jgi:hypothetical protein
MDFRIIASVVAGVLLLTCPAAALAVEPDGTLIQVQGAPAIYRVVGGAPVWISRCDYSNDCAGKVVVPNLSGYRTYPRDGALLQNVDDGGTYRIAGGAPMWLSRCNYEPGCPSTPTVDGRSMLSDGLRRYPVDGTLVANVDDGGLYRFAGGAPLLITRCDYGGGCTGAVPLDGGTFSRLGTYTPSLPHMRAVPADGTNVANFDDNGSYRFAGGAPLWIEDCSCGSAVPVDAGTLARLGTATAGQEHVRAYPPDGTYLRVGAEGPFHRVAGGAAIQLTDCSVLDGGCGGAVPVDAGTIREYARGHLRAVPADGTALRGVPSQTLWEVQGGFRRQTFVTVSGVQIDDAALAALPIFQPPPIVRAGPQPQFAPAITSLYRVRSGRTRFTALNVTGLPAGARVVVSCTGRGCPFRSKTFAPKNGRVDILPRIKRARLRAGAVLKVTASAADGARKVMTFRARSGARLPVRTRRCAPAGGKLARC